MLFSQEQFQEIIEAWGNEFNIKKHDGQVRLLEMKKTYQLSVNQPKAVEFMYRIANMHDYMQLKGEHNKIVITVTVKPENYRSFLKFCKDLQLLENRYDIPN